MATSRHRGWLSGKFLHWRKSAQRNTPYQCRLGFEPLESRRMLSTINWTNRNDFSGGTDNRFDDVFGPLANQAIAVVDATISQWQRVVSSFNYGDGGDTYSVTISMATAPLTTGTGVGAGASNIGLTNGKPSSATININYRAIAPSGNTSSGWWLDPSPMDNSEFIGVNAITSAWVGVPMAALGGADLFTGVLHELGHAMGLYSNATINAFTTDTGVVDTVNTPASAPPSNLWRFDSPNIHSLWTAWNSTGGTGMPGSNTNGAEHTAPAGIAPIMQNGRTYYAFTDLMNAAFTSRSLITDTHARMLQDAYAYTIALPSSFGTFYDRLDADGSLNILTPGNGNDTVDLQVIGANLFVSMGVGTPVIGPDPTGSFTSIFPLTSITSINIATGGGSDTVTIHPIYNSIPITLIMGASVGNDVLNVWGGAGYDSITVNTLSLVSTGITLSLNGVDALNIYTNGGDADVSIGAAIPTTINGSGSAEYIDLNSLDSLSPLTIFGNGGNDTISLAPDGGTNVIRAAVTVDGGTGSDTLNLSSGTLASLNAPITFIGGGGAEDIVVFNDQATSVATSYNITSTQVTRSPAFGGLTYSDLDRIVLNCGSGADTVTMQSAVTALVTGNGNNGDDNFIVGGGNLTGYFPQDFNGGQGNDQITYNDSLNPNGTSWDIDQDFHPNEIIYNGLISLFTTNFESVGILAGLSNDQINFLNDPTQNYNVNGGGGYDVFRWNALDNWFRDPNNGGAITLHAVNIDGGGDGGTLLMDDTTRNEPTQYDVTATSIFGTADTVYAALLNYTRLGALNVVASEQDNLFNVSSAAATTDYLLEGRGGADTFSIAIDPTAATAPFYNIDCRGGTGTDAFYMGDSAFSSPTSYAVADFRITRTSGAAERIFPLDSIESITVAGTAAADTFSVGSFTSGAALAINGAGGDDTLNFGNNNLASTVTNMASFNFDGQAGYNTFNLLSVNDGTGSYARNTGSVSYFGSSYSLTLFETNTQLMQIYPSSNGPSVSLVGVAPATTTAVHFNTPVNLGLLQMGVGSKKVTGIQGAVIFDGGANGSSISVGNGLDTIGRTVHLTQNTLGATPGDDLFPAGGSLTFSNIKAGGANPGLLLVLGSGADTLYAQPSATGTINLIGGSPTIAPGDTLNLNLASAVNFVITPTSPTSGNVTSDNLQTLTYSGFETVPAPPENVAAISFTGAYSQNFDTLPTSGTSLAWSNNSTLAGWSLYRQPAPGTAITTINAGTGSSSTGSFYSFGVLGSGPLTDRALGGLGSGAAYFGSPLSGNVAGWMTLGLTNDTGAEIGTLSLGYDGEQWRDGGNTSPQTMTLEYGFGNSFTTVPTWTAPGGSFDFTAPIHTAIAAALDGNAASNRTAGLGGTLNDLGWTTGSTLWVRWVENNDAGNDHALAIDNVQFGLPAAFFGDYNENGVVDAADYSVWRDTLGAVVTNYSSADGSGNGSVGAEDYGVWKANFGNTLPAGAGASIAQEQLQKIVALGTAAEVNIQRSNDAVGREGSVEVAIARLFTATEVGRAVGSHAAKRGQLRVANHEPAHRQDKLFMAWLSQPQGHQPAERAMEDGELEETPDVTDSHCKLLDAAYAGIGDWLPATM